MVRTRDCLCDGRRARVLSRLLSSRTMVGVLLRHGAARARCARDGLCDVAIAVMWE